MPFTPAHAAIVLPLIRSRYFSATGLIIGSMAPDFEYFFKMTTEGIHGHTLAGLFYFDLPVVVFLSFVFHLVVKKNLVLNLPLFFQKRLQPLLELNFVRYFKANLPVFLFSALLGSASHILWDSFTHSSGYFARELPFYKGTYVPFDGVKYPLFYALQHFSTAAGLTAVLFYIVFIQKPSTPISSNRPRLVYWSLLIFITVLIVWIRFTVKSSDYRIGTVVVSIITSFLIALIITGLINFKSAENDVKNA